MELVANVLNNLFHRTATHLAFLDLARTPVNDFVPFRFSICVHRVVKAGDKFAGKKRKGSFAKEQPGYPV